MTTAGARENCISLETKRPRPSLGAFGRRRKRAGRAPHARRSSLATSRAAGARCTTLTPSGTNPELGAGVVDSRNDRSRPLSARGTLANGPDRAGHHRAGRRAPLGSVLGRRVGGGGGGDES